MLLHAMSFAFDYAIYAATLRRYRCYFRRHYFMPLYAMLMPPRVFLRLITPRPFTIARPRLRLQHLRPSSSSEPSFF